MRAAVASPAPRLAAGVCSMSDKRLLLACADGVLEVTSIKPDGKREMDAASFCAGIREETAEWSKLA